VERIADLIANEEMKKKLGHSRLWVEKVGDTETYHSNQSYLHRSLV
jgi:hypothetical protein